jgi:adenylate cyclase
MAERNANLRAATRIEFRLGINLGDIIIDGDDIFGDGVNIAARLETLAELASALAAWCATRCATS